jgi:hypothetical protein
MTERPKGAGLFPMRIIFRRMLPISLAFALLFALIGGLWDLERWSEMSLGWVIFFVAVILLGGLLCAASIEWDNRRERRRWSVQVSNDLVSVADEKGRTTAIPTSDLQLVLAMGSQSAWREDLEIALFDESDEPLIMFPLVAQGGDNFVEWLATRKGFDPGEFAAARASDKSAAHVIWMAS